MSSAKGLTAIILCLSLALLAPGSTGWTACTKADYYCDYRDAIRAGSGVYTQSGVYGYNTGYGWGVFGRTTSNLTDIKAGVGGENLGYGPGVWGHSPHYIGVMGISEGWYGVLGDCPKGKGVFGNGETGVFGTGTHGVVGQSMIKSGYGVRGANTAGGVGVSGRTTSTIYAGVLGENDAGYGPGVQGYSMYGKGVYGYSAFDFGVYGQGKTYGVSGYGANCGVQGYSASGNGGLFSNSSATTSSSALKAQTAGTGWAGYFNATGLASHGVYIKTAGGQGLLVQGGTKSAVVNTSKGKRALYAEEASEVYFSDYGFGKLKDGKAVIAIDPLFAETVNANEAYHVFVQAYGKADLYVSNRTSNSFEVAVNSGDGNVEFSYRLVAKRKGFETARLEATPCPDDGPGLSPEKTVEKVAALTMP